MRGRAFFVIFLFAWFQARCFASPKDLVALKKDQAIGDLQLSHLYADSDQRIVGAKFKHTHTGAPVYFFQIETAPQVFMWVDTPPDSNQGLGHALEHLLAGKGTKGRYLNLLKEMRLSQSAAATTDDFNLYGFSSGAGLVGFFEQFDAWLDALYRPDFTDLEAQREFYHFGVSFDRTTKKTTLVEKGSVYDEMQSGQGIYSYYFELNKRVLGDTNPFGFSNSGVPDEMRQVTLNDIRHFYAKHYRLGPTTGFIFVVDPKENAFDFLHRISQKLRKFSDSGLRQETDFANEQPKYPVHPSANTEVKICPFPSSSEADRGEVRFGWKPSRTDSPSNLRLLQLFFRVLADGEQSLLYKLFVDSKTREFDSGATNVESLVFLENSPYFPAEFVGLSGIAGNRITVEKVEQLRSHILAKVAEVTRYPDGSQSLARFNGLVATQAKAWRRAQKVWVRSAPRFGPNNDTEWKEHLEYLEMDPSFIRSVSDEPVWKDVEQRLQSGKNVWRDLVEKFHLLDAPYATASIPSPQLLAQNEEARRNRIQQKIRELMGQFGREDEQEALARFEQEELVRTKEIDKIAAQVLRPKFPEHPPLTPDDDIRYRRLLLQTVPTIATFFDRAPTIDLGLSFDLRQIPRKYYKYLPILPRCLDSLGLKTPHQIVPYADLLAKTQSEINDFMIRYEVSPISRRADLSIRASATTPDEFQGALALIKRMTNFNYLELSNTDRLRDLVEKQLAEDDTYSKGGDDYWFLNPAYAFRYQDDPLYLALSSVFTRTHWDGRLKWLLHTPVGAEEINRLGAFADRFLDVSDISRTKLSERLSRSDAKGLEGELIVYWERNISSFPESELVNGLKRLTAEVQEDLKAGPAKTIHEIRSLQRLVLDRSALHIDLTLDESALDEIRLPLLDFVKSMPANGHLEEARWPSVSKEAPVTANVAKRYKLSENDGFPWYLGFEDLDSSTASMLFLANHPGYGDLDRASLIEVLSSKMVSGSGPHTFYMKTQEDGLAYGTSITSDPSRRLISYYAVRSPDIVSLVERVNSIAGKIPGLRDPSLIDYALLKTFSIPRSMSTFSERGRALAQDIRDGNEPERIRRFSEAILKLRNESNLLSELDQAALKSISPVLIEDAFTERQRAARSVFFFVGPERLLSEAERGLPIAKLLRIYASDFWLELPGDLDQTHPYRPGGAWKRTDTLTEPH